MILSTKSHRLGIWWECNCLPQNEDQRQDKSGKKEKECEQERQEKALLAQPIEDVVRKRFHEEDVVCACHPCVVPRQDGGRVSYQMTLPGYACIGAVVKNACIGQEQLTLTSTNLLKLLKKVT